MPNYQPFKRNPKQLLIRLQQYSQGLIIYLAFYRTVNGYLLSQNLFIKVIAEVYVMEGKIY